MTPDEKGLAAVLSNADLRTNKKDFVSISACYPAIKEAAEKLADISLQLADEKGIDSATAVELVKAAALLDISNNIQSIE